MTPLQTFLEVLEGAKKCGSGWSAPCPGHEDRRASLSIGEGSDGRVLLHCFAGCETEDIVKAAGLTMGDLFPEKERDGRREVARYTYHDEAGRELYHVRRYAPKDFRPFRPGAAFPGIEGVRRVLFRLPETLEAVKAGRTVYLVEGEKDVLSLVALGLDATTAPSGASSWRPEFAESLAGADVVILPDRNKAGTGYAEDAARSLRGKARQVRVVELPAEVNGRAVANDVTDYLEAGGTKEELLALVEAEELGAVAVEEPAESSPAEIIRRRSALNCERHATGIAVLDAKLSGGMPAGRSLFIVAPPEGGKTSLAVFMLHNMSKAGLHVGGLFPDEGRDAAAVRLGQINGLERDLLERGDPTTADRFAKATAGLSLDFMGTDSEKATVEELLRRGAVRSPEAVFVNVVDSLQRAHLDDEKPGTDLRLKVRANARACARGGGPRSIVVATGQANRTSYAARREQDRTRPEAAGAESSEIEFAADVQLVLEAVPDSDLVKVTVTKNRVGFRGEKGTLFLRLDRDRATYAEAPGEDVAAAIAEHQVAAAEIRADVKERRKAAQSEKAEVRVRARYDALAEKGEHEMRSGDVQKAMRVDTTLARELLKDWTTEDGWLHARKAGKSKFLHVADAPDCCRDVVLTPHGPETPAPPSPEAVADSFTLSCPPPGGLKTTTRSAAAPTSSRRLKTTSLERKDNEDNEDDGGTD